MMRSIGANPGAAATEERGAEPAKNNKPALT
jgi:hypothetical protein